MQKEENNLYWIGNYRNTEQKSIKKISEMKISFFEMVSKFDKPLDG
jgi:hypothetical protein